MARKPRIHYPGAVYHVMLRGNAGDPIFFEDRDRYRLYLILQHAVEKFGCRIHGFCLMTNHLHLVVQTGEMPLSRIMQNISLRYTRWVNATRGRTGHLFQGRYRALLIDADSYLLELVRYLHLNPVRGGAAATADSWPWSSHQAYAGREVIPWLTTDWVLGMLAAGATPARKAFVAFVNDGVPEGRRAEFHNGTGDRRILGDDGFTDTVLAKAREERPRIGVAEVVAAVCRLYGCSREELRAPGKVRPFTEARAVASLVVQELPHLSLTALGKELKRDVAPLGRVGRRLAGEASSDLRLRNIVSGVKTLLEEWQKG